VYVKNNITNEEVSKKGKELHAYVVPRMKWMSHKLMLVLVRGPYKYYKSNDSLPFFIQLFITLFYF
jgi:hypothetical protein